MIEDTRTTGQIAFEAYVESLGGIDSEGKLFPNWKDLSSSIKTAWEEAADAVLDSEEG